MKRGPKKKKNYTPVIDAELDLHGYYAGEARAAVLEFLNDAYTDGLKRVRIIVGKGNRSANGAVLPDTIKSLLNQEGFEYTYAKIQDGGEGALEVMVQ
jgi:DNA-nicking Smr family endonuclease